MTNTQTIVDAPHKDLRRARAASLSLIPTTTGSATAIGLIFPELEGQAQRARGARAAAQRVADRLRLRGRAPDDGRGGQRAARRPPPAGRSTGILGYEERPLVSVDFKDDPRSAIVDALSTMVVDGTQVKVLAWYDNEWGYANRLVELAPQRSRHAGASMRGPAREAMRHRRPSPRDDRRPAQLRARHRRLLGRHDHRRRDPHARALLLLRARLQRRSQSRSLFLFYEFFGIVTNLVGGWLAARLGLKATLLGGLGTQIVALGMLGVRAGRAGSSCPT